MTTALRAEAQAFVDAVDAKLLIGGEWVAPEADDAVEVVDPATEQTIATVADASAVDVHRAVVAARAASDSGEWGWLDARSRSRLLIRLAEAIEGSADTFAQIEALDNGKPYRFARDVDVEKAIEWFEYFAGWPTKLEGQTIPGPGNERLIYTLRQPVGVVGQIIPWNYPLMLAAWKLAPALAAGCSVILKPAEETPLSALLLGRLAQEVGFPPGAVNILTGRGETTGAALVAHPGLDKIAFTGSTAVGREIMERSAKHVRRLTFELGGNSPNIVLGDVDPALVADQLASAAWANHGQNCCAGTRLFVPRESAGSLVDAIVKEAASTRVGPGLAADTDMGPLISAVQRDRVLELIGTGRESGAEVVAGGGAPAGVDAGYFLEPTVLVGAGDATRVVREEIFGPVITVLPYSSVDEVVARANGTEYGLAAGVWTNDVGAAHRLARRLNAGTVWINTYNETAAGVPFGGFRQSGFGREHGSAVLDHYTETKAVWVGLDSPASRVG